MVGFLKLELRRFANGLDVGVREREESRMAGVFGGPAARKERVVIRETGKAGGVQAGQEVGCSMLDLLDMKSLLDLRVEMLPPCGRLGVMRRKVPSAITGHPSSATRPTHNQNSPLTCLGWEDGKERDGEKKNAHCLGTSLMGPERDTGSASRTPQPDEGDEKHKNSINIYLATFDFEALPGMIFLTASISDYKYSWATKFITPKGTKTKSRFAHGHRTPHNRASGM